jgi:N-acetylmuramoyl-L-alanine amidase
MRVSRPVPFARLLFGTALAATCLGAGAPANVAVSESPSPAEAGVSRHKHPLRRIKPPIDDWTIRFPPKRLHQTAAYSKRHYGKGDWRLRRVELIVEHMATTTSARAVHDTFAVNRPDVEFGELPGVCAHYLIAANGRIYRLVLLAIRCRHTVGLNHLSIGIEHVGHTPSDVLRNPRQLRASLRLTRWLRCRFDLPPNRAIGHAESLGSPYYKELIPAFRNRTHGDWRHAYMSDYRKRLRRTTCP